MANKARGQTALEYVLIVGGAILFVMLVVLILRSGIVTGGSGKIATEVEKLSKCYTRPNLIFFHNFDSGTAGKWTNMTVGWVVENKKYVQANTSGIPSGALTLAKTDASNFTMEFKARLTAPVASDKVIGAAINSSFDGKKAYYILFGDLGGGTGVFLYSIVNEIYTPVMLDNTIPLDITQEMVIKLKVYGTNIKVYVNGDLLRDWDVGERFGPGKLGFVTLGTGGAGIATAEFDDICVYKE